MLAALDRGVQSHPSRRHGSWRTCSTTWSRMTLSRSPGRSGCSVARRVRRFAVAAGGRLVTVTALVPRRLAGRAGPRLATCASNAAKRRQITVACTNPQGQSLLLASLSCLHLVDREVVSLSRRLPGREKCRMSQLIPVGERGLGGLHRLLSRDPHTRDHPAAVEPGTRTRQ